MLDAYFRIERDKLEAVLNKPNWQPYAERFRDVRRLVKEQDRSLLDAEMPVELCREALSLSTRKYSIDQDFLHKIQMPHQGKTLTALEAFDLFGGECLEEVEEYGSWRVPPSC